MKEQDKSLETNPKEMEVCELPDRELRITSSKSSMNSGKWCMNKVRVQTKRKCFKKPRTFRATEINNGIWILATDIQQ